MSVLSQPDMEQSSFTSYYFPFILCYNILPNEQNNVSVELQLTVESLNFSYFMFFENKIKTFKMLLLDFSYTYCTNIVARMSKSINEQINK